MKKIFLGLLSMFVLIGMSWAENVSVGGKIQVKESATATDTLNSLNEGAFTVTLTEKTSAKAAGDVKTATVAQVQGVYTYVFADVAAGTYELKAEGRANGSWYFVHTEDVTVSSDTIKNKNLVIVMSDTKFYYEVDVNTQGDYGYNPPIEGATVKVWAKTGGTEADAATDTTNSNGAAYVLMTGATGAHMVKVTAAGYKDKKDEKESICSMAEGKLTYHNSATITLEKDYGNLVDLRVALKEGSTNYTEATMPGEISYIQAKDRHDRVASGNWNTTKDTLVFEKVAVGAVQFLLNGTSGATSWGVVAASNNVTIAGEDGTSVKHDLVLERIAGLCTGTVATADGKHFEFMVEAQKGDDANTKKIIRGKGTYAVYGLTTGAWTLTAKTEAGFEAVAPATVTIAANSDNKTQNFTLVAKELEITFGGQAMFNNTATQERIYFNGAKVEIWKKGTPNVKLGEVVIPAQFNGSENYGNFELKANAKFGDSIICKVDDNRYNPREFKGYVDQTYCHIAIANEGWVARTVPVTKTALPVKDLAAAWVAPANGKKGGVNVTWAYPTALFNGNNWADGYKIQKIDLYRIDLTVGATSKKDLASWPQSAGQPALTKANLPVAFMDSTNDVKEDGYYSYVVDVRYEIPAADTVARVVYGAAAARLYKVLGVRGAWDGTAYGNKGGVNLTWNYPDSLTKYLGTTYKLATLNITRKDFSAANAVKTVKTYSFITGTQKDTTYETHVVDGKTVKDTIIREVNTYETDKTKLPKAFIDTVSGVRNGGNYSYTFELVYAQPNGRVSEVYYLDLTPKAPINAVAVWNAAKKVELTWGYPASLQAEWASVKPYRFEIERRDGSSATANSTVYYMELKATSPFDTLPVSFTDNTAEENGNYTYTLRLRYRDLGNAEVAVKPGEAARIHGVIDLDAVWVAETANQEAGVNLTWRFPRELVEGLGSTYKMQIMHLERRNAASATEVAQLMVWSKEQLQSGASLPLEYFDNTAAEDGNYNYIIRIRYEEPAATVETVKNLNMALSGVMSETAAWDATAYNNKGGIKLQWDYAEALKSGLGTTYKLRSLQIARRDLSTSYGVVNVKTFEYMTVTPPASGSGDPTVTYMTDASKLDKLFIDTVGVNNKGNYAYIFTLKYAQPEGQREKTLVIDLREEVTLAYSVSDATLGEITGSPASRAATTDLAAIKYYKGDLVSLKAQVKAGVENARFVAWKKGTAVVSTEAEYSFVIVENTTLVAEFAGNTTPTVRPLALDKPAAAWNAGTKRVDLTWDYPQAVKDGFGTDYKIQKIDLLRNDNALGGTSQVTVGYFNSFTTVENLPKSWYDTTAEAGKTYTYIFRIRYVDLGEKDTTAQVTIPVAVEVNELAATRIYPNPANGEFNVVVPVAAKMEIFAANGVLVKAEKVAANRKVAIRESGIYFVRLTTASGAVLVKRVVVR